MFLPVSANQFVIVHSALNTCPIILRDVELHFRKHFDVKTKVH